MDFRPMHADQLDTTQLGALRYPVLASPKMDGIRCIIRNGQALSRSLKPIPNAAVRAFLQSIPGIEGLDGELMVHGVSFQQVTSTFMSVKTALPSSWYFGVFDALPLHAGEAYTDRYARAVKAVAGAKSQHVVLVPQTEIRDASDLETYETRALELGFEGVMVRRPSAAYKFGRSRVSDGALLKLKRMADAEAEIVGAVELLHNGNAPTVNELGLAKRSSSKAGKKSSGALGAFVVRDLTTGVTFEVGTGFSAEQRVSYWLDRENLVGRIIKYKHFAIGALNKPRHPVFLGFRSVLDMGE